ncbi:hypothetical protein HPB48_002732 [Haemaphysalis longicornis]|uniref:C2H2-type domain-containing protein n=1 Tax=Haemaphysalis longicornis TaxID=44386 RepID=A0A9J6GQK0_HAELO|nr:hypothetical protein HPB48_002732 [Haemaphysalis longicornis]
MSAPEVFVIKQEVINEASHDEPMIVASAYADDSEEDVVEEVDEIIPGAENAASTTSPGGARCRVPCPTCHKVLANRTTLLKHIRIHTDERPYPCALCKRRFRQKEHRDKHTRIHAMVKTRPRSFKLPAHLGQHPP